MTAWLSIVGIGEDGLTSLNPEARAAIDAATLIVGGERHLALLPDDGRERKTWTSPLMDLVHEIIARRGEKICILATGDPQHFGIGVTFTKRLPTKEVAIFPSLSAFSLAAARLGWDLSRTECMTLHGRPLELLIPHLTNGARILALSDSGNTPANMAKILSEYGFGNSEMTVLEHMGGPNEKITSMEAFRIGDVQFQDFNTVALKCVANPDTQPLSRIPGLPDTAFMHDGQLTKQEIRSATLTALAPLPGDLLWDVGAGCGSIGIEWMRCHPSNQAISIEDHQGRLNYINKNKLKLGVPGLAVVTEKAPVSLQNLPPPDAIFIGGGLSTEGMFETCWAALNPGGRLVANAVTVEGETVLFNQHGLYGGSLTRIDVSRAEKIGKFTSWKPFRQVTQYRLVK
ncbi:precorrin-6y C5,15-methyltransferase (decarboxylating) subunit CbiE [Sneathiella marina]|uniref:Precorrin-6y C5,15-methyltransferase (Decarboxylating) subunit CbiE n=1 Tax=Sneathiella marina TaxID=2950108 RepID=A0ABY4W520_9PROT|nr:precorrin-6y C5,15-methyltransferase (decarboxylating) subunit CbiE [Sneathiella marina]USG62300.1 precorrin-6y C5,15-methyltransferase (decarboxylating) subunit CbiE [Sneathiella marina]